MRVLWISCFLAGLSVALANECQSKSFGKFRTVCVCNGQQCHTVDPVKPSKKGTFLKYTSTRAGLRLKRQEGSFERMQWTTNTIDVGNTSYQTIFGFGGAFTDAAGINIASLSEGVQEILLRSYYSEEGLEYNFGRVPMGATDFSTRGYSYHDSVEDGQLRSFALAEEDFKYKIPYIQRAKEISSVGLKFFTSTWIAPKWMKLNNAFAGKFGYIKEEYYQAYADYFVKFLDEYKKNDIDFWGLTTGNEPSDGVLGTAIPSVGWDAKKQRVWIAKNLGPTIRNSNYSNIKIMALDDQRIFIPDYIDELFEEEGVENYIDGIGVHWYVDMLTNVSRLDKCYKEHPSKFILITEVSKGAIIPEPQVQIGSWSRGEEYATSIIEDMTNWAVGWIDWNLALDTNGGPNFINNFVDAAILVNKEADEFYKQPMYYAMGHFSKFVKEGSVRIDVRSSLDDLPVIAFRRPDGGKVVVIVNGYNKKVYTTLKDNDNKINLELAAHSITTIAYW